MQHLVIRLQEDSAPVQWAIFDEDGRVVSHAQSGPLEAAAEAAPGRRVVVLVPGVDTVLVETTLPKASNARLRKMLPFSLEDSLAEDVEELVFAVGRRSSSGSVAVAVAARARLDAWLARVSAAGITPHAVCSDADGVPDTPSTLTLVVEGERVYGRAPGASAFVAEGLQLAQVVEVIDRAGELKHAVVYLDERSRTDRAAELAALGGRIADTQVKLMPDGALSHLGATLVVQPGTNFLQGEYAPRSNVGALLRPWRAAAALLVGLVLVGVAAQAAEYFALRQQNQALSDRLAQVCEDELSTPLASCDRVVRQRLSQAGALGADGGGFLATLDVIADARPPSSRVSALQYIGGRMTIELGVQDVSALDAFVREAERADAFQSVRVQSSTNVGAAGIEARLELIETGAPR